MPRKRDIFAQVKPLRRSQLIEEQIRGAILTGHYKIGEKLPPERELAGLFGTSRSIVREALRALEKSHLLAIKTGVQGGAFVTEVDKGPVIESINNMMETSQISHEEIAQVRLFLEPPVAAEAAKKATAHDMERLKEANRVLDEGFKTGDTFIEHNPNPNMHKIIAEITGNRLLIILIDLLMDITTQRLSHIKMDSKTKKTIARAHRNIVRAIELKDDKKASELMMKHVKSVYKTQKALEEAGHDM